MVLTVCRIGSMPYGEALALQYELVEARRQDRIGNTLLLLEHPSVLTLGTRTEVSNIYCTDEQLSAAGIEKFEVNRGGDVTFHGPGQIVGYPIVQLKEFEQGIRWFISTLEESLISVLKERYGIEAYPQTGKFTGVWVGEFKIAAFGLAVVNGVTMHGFAFNVNTDLQKFNLINPCGLSKGVTSVEQELGCTADIDETFELVIGSISQHFGFAVRRLSLDGLRAELRHLDKTSHLLDRG
ncbi:MAG: lipoyl(octanoyl) transferase LipB [Saccharofermentanales bacterium]